jgi:hypothetical protein
MCRSQQVMDALVVNLQARHMHLRQHLQNAIAAGMSDPKGRTPPHICLAKHTQLRTPDSILSPCQCNCICASSLSRADATAHTGVVWFHRHVRQVYMRRVPSKFLTSITDSTTFIPPVQLCRATHTALSLCIP